jgi:hypothetical protein
LSPGALQLGALSPEALSGTWNDEAISRWFAGAAVESQVPADRTVAWPEPRPSRFRRTRLGPVDVRDGSSVGVWVVPRLLLTPATVMNTPDALISLDGRLYVGWEAHVSARGPVTRPMQRFSLAAIVYLAARLGFDVQWHSRVVARP